MAFTTKFTDIKISDEMLDTDALQILSSATDFVAKILQARDALDNAGQEDKPLFVVIGEQHDMPSHRIHALSVLDQIRQVGKSVAWADELPYNDFADSFFGTFDRPYDEEVAAAVMAHDRKEKGALSILGDLCFSTKLWADHADKLLLMYLFKNAVHTAFTDAAQSQIYVTPPESRTSVSAQECLGKVPPILAVHAPDGIYVRNHMMVTGMQELAEESGAGIVMQRCGGKHVLGNAESELPYDQSLLGLLHKQGQPAMGYGALGGVLEDAPNDAPSACRSFVTISELPEWKAHKGMRDDGSHTTATVGHFRHSSDEESYSAEVMNRLQLSDHFYSYAELTNARDELIEVVADRYEAWARKYYKVEGSPKP